VKQATLGQAMPKNISTIQIINSPTGGFFQEAEEVDVRLLAPYRAAVGLGPAGFRRKRAIMVKFIFPDNKGYSNILKS
jgi:hypothetical protein